MIDFDLKPELFGEETEENARRHKNLMSELNYLITEGFIEVEQDSDGQIRLFVTSQG